MALDSAAVITQVKLADRILGLDPGTAITGWGMIAQHGRCWQAVDYGTIRPPKEQLLSARYHWIYRHVLQLIERYQPAALVVETQYVAKNPQSALKLGMARGAILIAAVQAAVPVFEYTPSRAKQAVTGRGQASKEQVQAMMRCLLNLTAPIESTDAADALALALCHAQAQQSSRLLGELI